MKMLRMLHLYLGCIFAPLLIFFAVSGVWQTFNLRLDGQSGLARVLVQLSSIHTGHEMKLGHSLSSPGMHWLVAAMAVSLIFTIVLGVVMAFKFGHQRIAAGCLLAGILTPLVLVLFALFR